ncbi:uncharacterized protein LOC117338541 [Pecten maximus]|uniref:uncharacterized protein LOC117338541 n=1 Tax=Pecten maximus TaxID=6579 RepID=UPI001458C005|nr:uncharacterized protein LOC117338541 [Pecten maximus]
MDKKDKEVLKNNETYLRENLDILQILPRLYQESVISDDDRERIEREATTRDKITKFLRIIKRKQDVYRKLLEVLDVEGLHFIREKLESTEIDEDVLKKEQESDEDFLKEQLLILYQESYGESISYNTLESDIRRLIYLEGKDLTTEKHILVRLVEQVFSTAKFIESCDSKQRAVWDFKNLRRRSLADDNEKSVISVQMDGHKTMEDIVRGQVLLLFRESVGKEVPVTTLERDIELSLPGTNINLKKLPLTDIVKNAYPKVEYKKVKRKKRHTQPQFPGL